MAGGNIATGWGPLSWEGWIALGTWILAAATWYLAHRSKHDARTQIAAMRDTAKAQVAAAQQAAKEQIDVTERMAKTHIETLEEDLKTRILLHYESLWDSQEMIAHRKALSQNFLGLKDHPSRERIFYEDSGDAVPNFFESVGVHLQEGHLETELVFSIFGYYAMRYGQMLGSFIVQDRQTHNDEGLWSGFLYLFATLGKFETRKLGHPRVDFSMEEIVRFLEEEAG